MKTQTPPAAALERALAEVVQSARREIDGAKADALAIVASLAAAGADPNALGDLIAELIGDHVERALAPLFDRVATLEGRALADQPRAD